MSTVTINKTQTRRVPQQVKATLKSVLETDENNDSESEYVNLKECQQILDLAEHKLVELHENLNIKKKNYIALEKVTQEIANDNKSLKSELGFVKKQLDVINEKQQNRKSISLNNHKIISLLSQKDEEINDEINNGIEDLVEQYRKLYK